LRGERAWSSAIGEGTDLPSNTNDDNLCAAKEERTNMGACWRWGSVTPGGLNVSVFVCARRLNT